MYDEAHLLVEIFSPAGMYGKNPSTPSSSQQGRTSLLGGKRMPMFQFLRVILKSIFPAKESNFYKVIAQL